jgi:hypothetical protein
MHQSAVVLLLFRVRGPWHRALYKTRTIVVTRSRFVNGSNVRLMQRQDRALDPPLCEGATAADLRPSMPVSHGCRTSRAWLPAAASNA